MDRQVCGPTAVLPHNRCGTGLGVSVSNGKTAFDLATQSVVLAFVINTATPGATTRFMGNSDSTSNKGFYLLGATNGTIRSALNTSTGVVSTLQDGSVVTLDGTDHSVLVATDGVTKSIHVYIDRVLADTYLNAFTGNTAGTIGAFNIGSFGGSMALATTYAAKFYGIHHLVFNERLRPQRRRRALRSQRILRRSSSPHRNRTSRP